MHERRIRIYIFYMLFKYVLRTPSIHFKKELKVALHINPFLTEAWVLRRSIMPDYAA